MSEVKEEKEAVAGTSKDVKPEEASAAIKEEKHVEKEEIKYFQCDSCGLKECYEYFGNDPPFVKHYKLLENCYVIEDPFVAPKQNEFIVLGTHCIKCGKSICKDTNCSMYYEGSYCINCAKSNSQSFPPNVQEKLNRIVTI